MEVFIEHRMKGKLDPTNEKKLREKGGRPEAGRPKGTTKEPTKQIRLPIDIAAWISQPSVIESIRQVMKTYTPRK